MKFLLGVAVCLVAVVSISGCGSSSNGDESSATSTATTPVGDAGAEASEPLTNPASSATTQSSSTPRPSRPNASTPSSSGGVSGASGSGAGGMPGAGGMSGMSGAGGSWTAAGAGGMSGAGGSSTAAGAGGGAGGNTAAAPNGDGGIRDIPATQIVAEMFLGWNLGNTLDADPDETSWGNPRTTQAMMNAVHDAGFNTVRIPVTWTHHMGGAPDYTVDGQWMDRVEEVTNYVLSTGMYAIVNTHHEDWVSLMPNDDHDAVSRELEALWTQIATRFRDYDDHLVFEVLNEPRTTDSTEWTGGTPEARQILNGYNLAAVNAIRATGGNNRERFLMVPTHAANPSNETIADLVIPNDDPHIIVSLHTYYPYELSLGDGTQWGSNQDRDDMAAELDRIHDLLPARGRAVVIGEWGTENRNNTQVRADHAATYARMVRERGMCPIWWDNGVLMGSDAFGLLDRQASPPRWGFQDIVTGLVDGATAGSP